MTWRSDHRREAAEREAIAWLLRLDVPDAPEADWLALRVWLEAAPEHREAFDRAERVSAELTGAARDLVRALDSRAAPQRRRPTFRSNRLYTRVWPAAASLAAAAAALAVFVAVRPAPPGPSEVFQTAKGETRVLKLADGSRLHLNSGSRIAVRLERKVRYVDLTEGEVAFDVAKDAARPFLIAAGERNIRVVGTEFDVLRHQGRLRVTVRRGVVAVQSPEAANLDNAVLLKAGDQLEHLAGSRISTLQRVDPEAAFAWRRGNLIYRDQTLAEVVTDLNRYYDAPVSVAGGAADLRFSGVLVIDKEDAVVRRLQAYLPIAVDRRGQGFALRMRNATP